MTPTLRNGGGGSQTHPLGKSPFRTLPRCVWVGRELSRPAFEVVSGSYDSSVGVRDLGHGVNDTTTQTKPPKTSFFKIGYKKNPPKTSFLKIGYKKTPPDTCFHEYWLFGNPHQKKKMTYPCGGGWGVVCGGASTHTHTHHPFTPSSTYIL